MAGRSFIGVGVLVGLIGGAVVGINFGNLGPSLLIGVVAGLGLGWVIDRLKAAKGSGPGNSSDGGTVFMTADGGGSDRSGPSHHSDGGHGGGDSGGGDGGGD